MSIADKFRKICMSLGENNNPAYAVMAIATVKGICRPMFTMMDKKEKPETKKYTALREGLTEAIAIPAYWGTATLAGKMANLIKGDKSAQTLAKKNLLFIGVCTAALFVIPATCSLVIKPFMKFIQGDKKEDNGCPVVGENKLDTGSTNNLNSPKEVKECKVCGTPYEQPHLASFALVNSRPQFGLKVGGV